MPRAMQGKAPTLAISNLADFNIRAGPEFASVQGGFEAIYDQTVNDALHGTGKNLRGDKLPETSGIRLSKAREWANIRQSVRQRLLQIAQLIKAGVGLEWPY